MLKVSISDTNPDLQYKFQDAVGLSSSLGPGPNLQ